MRLRLLVQKLQPGDEDRLVSCHYIHTAFVITSLENIKYINNSILKYFVSLASHAIRMLYFRPNPNLTNAKFIICAWLSYF